MNDAKGFYEKVEAICEEQGQKAMAFDTC